PPFTLTARFLHGPLQGRAFPIPIDERNRLLRELGAQLEAYHRLIGFHRVPHLGNMGLKRVGEDRYQIVLRDLDTTQPRQLFRDHTGTERVNEEVLWRLNDLTRLTYDFHTGQEIRLWTEFDGEWEQDGALVIANARNMVPFLFQGYFEDAHL